MRIRGGGASILEKWAANSYFRKSVIIEHMTHCGRPEYVVTITANNLEPPEISGIASRCHCDNVVNALTGWENRKC